MHCFLLNNQQHRFCLVIGSQVQQQYGFHRASSCLGKNTIHIRQLGLKIHDVFYFEPTFLSINYQQLQDTVYNRHAFCYLGDQILDVDGVNVNNMTIEEVSEVLRSAPILMTCTVKPANHFKYAAAEPTGTQKSSYAEIDIDALAAEDTNANHIERHIAAGYEDDQSSTESQGYVIMPSDDELEADEIPEVNDSQTTTDKSEYVNLPEERHENATAIRPPSPQNAHTPVAQRNYLELCFDEDES